jgi:hypothetical protein
MEAASKFLSRNSSGSRQGGQTGGMVAVTVSNNGIGLAQLSKIISAYTNRSLPA